MVPFMHPVRGVKPSRPALLQDTRGANVVEYIVLVGVIALIAVAGFRIFGSSVESKIDQQAQCVSNLGGCEGTASGASGEGALGGGASAAKKGSGSEGGAIAGAAPSEGALGQAKGAVTKGSGSGASGSGASGSGAVGAGASGSGASGSGASGSGAQGAGALGSAASAVTKGAGAGATGSGAVAGASALAAVGGTASGAGAAGTGAGAGAQGGAAVQGAASALSAQSGGPSYNEQVAGTNPKPVDGELAQLAAAVYNDEGAPPGWTKLSDEQLAAAGINPALLEDPSTGFKAGIYMNDKGQVVLSYAGTSMTSWQDWKNNLGQGLGWGAAQYTQAVALAQDAKLAFGDNMVITGHSLGGGLAATAAIATNTTAVTFNAAGVHDDTIKSLGLDPKKVREQTENGQIRRYVVDGEILTHVQEHAIPSKWVAPDGLGKKIVLNDPNPLNWKQKLIPGAETKHRVDNHMMTEVQDALRKDPQW